MNNVNAIALNLMSLGSGSLRGLSLGDVALIIAWTLILIVYVAGQALRFPRKRRSKNQPSVQWHAGVAASAKIIVRKLCARSSL